MKVRRYTDLTGLGVWRSCSPRLSVRKNRNADNPGLLVATFLPVALTIDVEVGDPEAAARALSVIGSEDIYSSRVVFHETVHYWQQLSQGFLLRRAEEDWQRLIDYERAGQVGRDDSVSREFYREEPTLGFSAHDLQECLARFWEVVALSPNRIMRDDWISDRSSFHPDYIKANRQSTFHKRRGALPPWRDDDFRTAMM